MSHLWLSTEGVFGVALGVSSGFVFLYVLFGALLDTGGAGNYFIKSALSLLGHMRGGPAKAAVVSSGLTGLISGSSIANVVTVGTFTIPLMKRVGYKPHVAGAIETAASVDGQIMPPVMGAAAFLMVEYVGIPYTQIIKHAALPAIMSYIALFYIVHLEACKANLKGIPREVVPPLMNRLVSFVMTISGVVILANIVYFGLGWIKDLAGAASVYIIAVLMLIAYIGLLRYEARYPELHMEDPHSPILTLPQAGPTLKSGLHFLLPVAALIWNLMVEELSPALSAFWATIFLMFILVTQRPLSAFFRGRDDIRAQADQGFADPQDRSHRRRPQHDRRRHRHLDRRHHRRHRDADRHRSRPCRSRRADLGRQPAADAGDGGGCLADPWHGRADDGQLHHRLVIDGAGRRRTWRPERPDRAAESPSICSCSISASWPT